MFLLNCSVGIVDELDVFGEDKVEDGDLADDVVDEMKSLCLLADSYHMTHGPDSGTSPQYAGTSTAMKELITGENIIFKFWINHGVNGFSSVVFLEKLDEITSISIK